MRAIASAFLVLSVSVWAAAAHGDTADLSDGVLIVHAGPALECTNWCEMWPGYQGIEECGEQRTRMEFSEGTYLSGVMHVIAAWSEPKEFCQVEFGLGDFDGTTFLMWDYCTDACFAGTGVVTSTAGWPGPNEGVVLTATDIPWSGDMVHLYAMGFYAYAYTSPPPTEIISLAPHPVSGFAGAVNCEDPSVAFAADCLGALGVGTDGVYCCPAQPTPVGETSWSAIKYLYR